MTRGTSALRINPGCHAPGSAAAEPESPGARQCRGADREIAVSGGAPPERSLAARPGAVSPGSSREGGQGSASGGPPEVSGIGAVGSTLLVPGVGVPPF